jgi:hypothetical protein
MRHRFHSICPYFAMFPESFADKWIGELTRPGEVVLDPFSGRGTTATCALLAGRRAVATDVNDVAYCLTKAKTNSPTLKTVQTRLQSLKSSFVSRRWAKRAANLPEFFQHAFHPDTLRQIVYLRETLAWRTRKPDVMLAALGLGSLHGESTRSQSYFSNQMPRTISTKPAYSIRFWKERGLQAPRRDVFDVLEQRLQYRYVSPRPQGEALILHRDMRELPWLADSLPGPIRCVITSPPYFDVTNFEEDQWLRLWFLGGPPHPTKNRLSRDDRHSFAADYWRFVSDMWRSLGSTVAPQAQVVIRLGSSRIPPDELRQQLLATSRFSGRKVKLLHSEVSAIEGRQTDVFRPGAAGCKVEVDCLFQVSGNRSTGR